MLRRWIVAVLVMVARPGGPVAHVDGEHAGATGRYIVVLKDSAHADAVAGRATGLGATVNSVFSSLNTLVVVASAAAPREPCSRTPGSPS